MIEFLLKSGHRVVVDDDCAYLASLRGWYLHSTGYVAREISGRRLVFLHHEVMGTRPSRATRIDRVDRDVFNNQRGNLRVVTPSQNAQNRAARKSNGLPRGVYWSASHGKWVAVATINYKRHYLGYFDDPEAAGRVVGEWRRKHMTHSESDRVGSV